MLMTGINNMICNAKPYCLILPRQYLMLLLSLCLQYYNLGNISEILIFFFFEAFWESEILDIYYFDF